MFTCLDFLACFTNVGGNSNMRAIFILIYTLRILTSCTPILDVEIGRLKLSNGDLIVLHYIDMPENIKESVHLNCEIPVADDYEWKIFAKLGTPHAGHVILGEPSVKNVDEKWSVEITQQEYPWPVLLVTCVVSIQSEYLVTFAWVILKMKSNTDTPFHPVICQYSDAECVPKKFDCIRGNGADYLGNHDRTVDGDKCQPWISYHPNKPYMEYARLDIYSGHNYCRNPDERFYSKPMCITSRYERDQPENKEQVYCEIPHCHDCMFGTGDGKFPNFASGIDWNYPLYDGNGKWTKLTEFDMKGNKVHRKCHVGKSDFWKDNVCRMYARVADRSSPSAVPSCLAVPDREESEQEADFPETVWSARFKWVTCVSPQCTVRQMWFLLVDPNKAVYLAESNADLIEIPIMIGRSSSIKFFHFGTNLCAGMSVEAEESVRVFLKFFELKCNPTPQMSEIIIKQATLQFQGKYNIKYIFQEGDHLIEPIEYTVNFRLVIKDPTTISLSPLAICPGYQGQTKLNIKGSFKLITDSIKWLYSHDGKTWIDTETQLDNFDISLNALSLTVRNIAKSIYMKVTASSDSGSVETKIKINMLKTPHLKLRKSSISGVLGEQIRLIIECDLLAKSVWIFNAQIIDRDNPGKDYLIVSHVQENSDKRIETLIVKSLHASLQGIYNIQVEENDCKATDTLYVNLK